jgi:hypothetical protein
MREVRGLRSDTALGNSAIEFESRGHSDEAHDFVGFVTVGGWPPPIAVRRDILFATRSSSASYVVLPLPAGRSRWKARLAWVASPPNNPWNTIGLILSGCPSKVLFGLEGCSPFGSATSRVGDKARR